MAPPKVARPPVVAFLVSPLVASGAAAIAAVGGASAKAIFAVALGAGGFAAIVAAIVAGGRTRRRLGALADAVEGLAAGDFSVRLAIRDAGPAGALAAIYNDLADALASERGELRRRELLLGAALEASPGAVLLLGDHERVLYANRAARVLFRDGRALEGQAFAELAAASPVALREALDGAGDAVVTVPLADGEETFQVQKRSFDLDARRRKLLLVRRITVELRRQEVSGWKKAIRVIGHEVRSHLAAMVSLTRSARQLAARGEAGQADELLDDVEQAGSALERFIDGYGRFARLSEPRRETVVLGGFFGHLARLEAFHVAGRIPAAAVEVDPGQMQQVLMNLLKNAREAGSPAEEIVVATAIDGDDWQVEVRDRGRGMDEQGLARAFLPLHSTKPDGTGLGLALCREIVEAHGGWIRLESRPEGGVAVLFRLPGVARVDGGG